MDHTNSLLARTFMERDHSHVNRSLHVTWCGLSIDRANNSGEGPGDVYILGAECPYGQRDHLENIMKLSPTLLNLYGLLCLSLTAAAFTHGPQAVNFKLLERRVGPKASHFARFTIQDSRPNGLAVSNATGGFPEQWFTQPIDHYCQDSPTFKQRYWVNKRHYVPGSNGPVIVIDSGETSGENRLPFLDTGIAEILAKATGGIGVVLEHRYVR